MKLLLESVEGFEWNDGNSNKNWHLHTVTDSECEEVFFSLPLIIASDKKHSDSEIRFFALGRTESNRWLFLAFTLRNKLIRVISAREMTKSESKKYYEKIKRDTEV
jgi:uncharacterized protein